MQHTGTLKKRRRRNLNKVKGLSTIPYNENLDDFTGKDLFHTTYKPTDPRPISTTTQSDTRLQFTSSAMLEHRRQSYNSFYSRVTRNPSFHSDTISESDYFDDSISRSGTATTYDLGPFAHRRHVDKSIKTRSHFLDPATMKRLKQIIWLGITSGALPWKWNEQEHRIDRWSPFFEKLWWIQWFFVTIQNSCLFCFQVYAFYNMAKGEHSSYREVFMGSNGLLWYSYTTLFNINLYFYREKTRLYINNLFRFNHQYVQSYLIHLDDYQDGGRWVINFAAFTNFSQVAACVFFFSVMPYLPWYLFSYIYPKPWYWQIPGAMQEYMMAGQVITSYNLLTWIIVAHSNTVEFWLQETHNSNETDYTSDELRTPRKAMETYRILQILTKCFNECMAPLAIPLVKYAICTAMIPCGYVIIRSMNQKFIDEFPAILTYPLGILDCSVAGFVVLNMGAAMFDLGCSFIDSWSRTKQKDFRRILISCPALKMWVGRWYFITLSTTITFFKACFDIITDCIITFP